MRVDIYCRCLFGAPIVIVDENATSTSGLVVSFVIVLVGNVVSSTTDITVDILSPCLL